MPSTKTSARAVRATQLKRILALCGISLAAPALASGGGSTSGPAPLTFVSNIGKTGLGASFLQVQLVMVPASPEAAKQIDAYKPMLQHRVLLVLSSMSIDELRSAEGRKELAEILVEELNIDLNTSMKDGIKEIFFTSFIIQ